MLAEAAAIMKTGTTSQRSGFELEFTQTHTAQKSLLSVEEFRVRRAKSQNLVRWSGVSKRWCCKALVCVCA